MVNKSQSVRRFRIFLDVVMWTFIVTFLINFIGYLFGAYGLYDESQFFGYESQFYDYSTLPIFVTIALMILLTSYTISTFMTWGLAIFFLCMSLFQQKDNWSKIWPVLFTIFIIAFLSTELNWAYNTFFIVVLFFYFKKYRPVLKSIEK